MKNLSYLLTLTVVIFNSLFYSCKKDSDEGFQTDPPIPNVYPPILNTNKPPIAVAGPDQTITLPADSILLNGSASNDPDGRVTACQWKKISGPSSFNIVNANSVLAQATNLAEGVYLFELTVTDSLGLFDKDTTTVSVIKIYTNEIIFNDQSWVCNYGVCWISIPDLYSHLPAGTSIKVLIKRDNTNTWVEASRDFQAIVGLYTYSVSNDGHLEVYTYDPNHTAIDTPDIKIMY